MGIEQLEKAIANILAAIDDDRKELASRMEQLAERLKDKADRLRAWDMTDSPRLMINDLGEIQAEGSAIDSRCAFLAANWDGYERLIALRS